MPGAGESRLLKIHALLASLFHIPNFQRPYECAIRQAVNFTADLFETKQLDDDTHKAVDALEAAQANPMKLVNMQVKC
jgi:hypothetical protein